MAYKRIVLGNVSKAKEGNSRYLKVNMNPKVAKEVTLKNGDYINIESFEELLANAQQAVEDGKLGPDVLESIRTRIEKDRSFGAFAQAVLSVKG